MYSTHVYSKQKHVLKYIDRLHLMIQLRKTMEQAERRIKCESMYSALLEYEQ